MKEEFRRLLEEAKAFFDEKDKVREKALVLCREITRIYKRRGSRIVAD